MKNRCPTCVVVDRLCFWGDLPQRQWKRPLLFLLSLAGLVGTGYLLYAREPSWAENPLVMVLFLVCPILLILALIVSVTGCDRCVARFLGEV